MKEEIELIDDFHPLACSLIGEVGSSYVFSQVEKRVREKITEPSEKEIIGVGCDTNPERYYLRPDDSRRLTWTPDVKLNYSVTTLDEREDPMETFSLYVPAVVRARLSDVPELKETESIPDDDLEFMKTLSQRNKTEPCIITVCLDRLPSHFEVTDLTFVSAL